VYVCVCLCVCVSVCVCVCVCVDVRVRDRVCLRVRVSVSLPRTDSRGAPESQRTSKSFQVFLQTGHGQGQAGQVPGVGQVERGNFGVVEG
jgi:hypothetical protein